MASTFGPLAVPQCVVVAEDQDCDTNRANRGVAAF